MKTVARGELLKTCSREFASQKKLRVRIIRKLLGFGRWRITRRLIVTRPFGRIRSPNISNPCTGRFNELDSAWLLVPRFLRFRRECLSTEYPVTAQGYHRSCIKTANHLQMSKTYKGSCMCQTIKFEADIDLSKPTSKCNCSLCSKNRFWSIRLRPENFRFISESGTIDELLTEYIHARPNIRRYFCKKCGIHPFMKVEFPSSGGEMVSISVNCLDDVSPEEWAKMSVQFLDGLNNNWANQPKETNYM